MNFFFLFFFQKKVQKSASVSNLSFLTKRLSFSRFSRKVADQKPTTPMSVSPALAEEDDMSTDSLSSRRKSSLLSDSSWSATRGHSGPLTVYVKGKKTASSSGSSHQKWVVLGSTHLKYFNQSDSMVEPKEMIPLKDVLSIHGRVDDVDDEEESDPLYCFDVAYLKPGKGNKLSIRTFACQSQSVRDGWVDKIAQSLSSGLANFSLSSNAERGKLGWVYLKAMFAGEWQVSWIALKGTSFLYQATPDVGEDLMEEVDLKKTKNVTLVRDIKNLSVLEPSVPVLVVDFADRSLYLQSRSEKETLHWQAALEDVAFSNVPLLSDQQLTKDGVPVVVEQCVNFVFRHGCMSEGIYRHSGVKTKIDRLLAEFSGNAWSVAVTREEYSEHDVAGALKRFMRTLKDPVLTKKMRADWLEAAGTPSPDAKLARYEELLASLPDINRLTLRRLIGHLRAVSNQSERNRMPDFNLAAIWGPTLLTVDEQAAPSNFAQTSAEADVCRDLIEHYRRLFSVTDEEISREEKIMKKTENFNRNPNPIKLSGTFTML